MEKDIENYLKLFPDDISLNDKKLFLKYFSSQELSLEEIERLEKIYLENITKQKNKLEEKIKVDSIKTLVTFISYSYTIGQPQYLENILDKNIRIFNNVNNIVLIYTTQTEKIYNAIKNSYLNKNIIGILFDNASLISLGYLLNRELKNINSTPNETIIDITLGMKIVTIAFYKLAVEKGIYTINWIEKNIPKLIYKDNKYQVETNLLSRIPFNSQLELLIEPQKENLKIYEYINSALKVYNFEAVQGYYNQIGNIQMEFFYQKLSEVFNLETFMSMDFGYFYQKVELFLKTISDYNFEREIILKFSKYITYLLALVYYEVDDSNSNAEERNFIWLDRLISRFKISIEILEEIAYTSSEYREAIYYHFILNYFYVKKKNSDLYYYDKFIKQIKKSIITELGIEDENKKNLFFRKDNMSILPLLDLDIDDILEVLEPGNTLCESILSQFYFKEKILFIEKYNLKIDTAINSHLSFINKKGCDLIRKLLNNYTEELGGEELFKHLSISTTDDRKKQINRFRRNLTSLKNKINDFNENIKLIGTEYRYELEDIIIYKKDKTKPTDLSHSFRINPKYYTLV